MSSDPAPAGFALLCDPQGIVRNVLLDSFGLDGSPTGESLEKKVDRGSQIKFLNFLIELRGRGAAFNWEINFLRQGRLVTLLVTGILGDAGLMIVAARTPYDALALSDVFLNINPDQAAALHAAIHDHLRATPAVRADDGSLYDEITRLNNELLVLQRELAKKNAGLEQRVQDRTARLKAANQELEAFSYSISHELRAPLRSINGWSQVLLDEYQERLDEDGREIIASIRGETQRMAQLIDDLLRLSGVSQAELKRAPVDLSWLGQAIAARLQAGQPDRPVECVIQPGLKAVGDPDLLEILLANLLSNAFKFTGKTAHPCIELGSQPGEDGPLFFVRDNGVGFNMANASNLFGAFQTMHRQSDFPGIGVGLAIAQRIINRHGGKIWAEARVDHGATFYFRLLEQL